jgi:perosamine synthetase
MLRFVPPAGAPVPITDIFRAGIEALSRNGKLDESLASFGTCVRSRYVIGASSGRAALWLILKGLHRLRPERFVVAVPAYTCFSVAASVVRAGLKLYPVDMDPETLDFDFSELENLPEGKLLCVLSANLFGLMSDVPRIQQIARAKGALVIDDAAQALGATRNGDFSGTLGDVGFYSLARGKALGAGEGGIIVTDSPEIAAAIQAELGALSAPSSGHVSWLFLQLLATSVFINPRLYWVPNSLPFLKLGTTEFDPCFGTKHLSKIACALLPLLMERLEEMNRVRRGNAAILALALEGNRHFNQPKPAEACEATYTRFPLVAKNETVKSQALRRLQEAGIGASPFYPSAICDIPGIGSHMAANDFHRPKAESLSRRLFTLPTHPLLTRQDLNRVSQILNGLEATA